MPLYDRDDELPDEIAQERDDRVPETEHEPGQAPRTKLALKPREIRKGKRVALENERFSGIALPPGVTIAAKGQQQFVTQRGYWTAEYGYTSCMFAAVCSILAEQGYVLPLHRTAAELESLGFDNFVFALHKASGSSLYSGTSIADTKKAMSVLLPETPMLYGSLSNDEFLAELEKGAAIRVTATCDDFCDLGLPCGCVNVGHAYAIVETRMTGAIREVFIFDPMGRPASFAGKWAAWDKVRPHLRRNADREIFVTLGYRDAVVAPPEPVEPQPTIQDAFVAAGFAGSVQDGTPVVDKAGNRTKISASSSLKSLLMPDGKRVAALVTSSRLPGPNPKVVFIDRELVAGVPEPAIAGTVRTALAGIRSQIDALEAQIGEKVVEGDQG
jgi:hypothetical protein